MDFKDSKNSKKANKLNKSVFIAIAVILIVGVVYLVTGGVLANALTATTVQSGDTVGVYYIGSFTNGTVFNSNVGQSPFNFTVGANEVIPGFNQAVIGMKINQTKNVTIPVNEAYGYVNPNLILEIPPNDINGTITVGETLHGTLGGHAASGIVTFVNVTNATARVDFNSPLAGHVLVFKITVVSITKGNSST
jgi:FKBP-type peptidyl-prolyl cis-trans isomerase 2